MTVIRWLLLIELYGISSWPLCYFLFRRLPEGGLGLARLLGMLLVTYAAWLSARTGLFPYDTASLVSFLLVYIVIAVLSSLRHREEITAFLREKKRIIAFEHLFFLSIYFAAVFIQSYKPDITLAEKQPDMMYLQAVLRARSMPPEDLWFAGATVNYYYFGYLVFGALARLAAARPEIAINLAVASVVPLSCLAAFSTAYNLTRRRAYALLAPLFLLGLGNLRAAAGIIRAGRIAGWNWWYEIFSHGSREVIPGTIHEFPCFSFLLGDLHPHYMFMPFAFLLLSLLIVFYAARTEIAQSFSPRRWALHGFVFSLILGSAFMFHSWDYPGYILLSIIAVSALAWQDRPLRKRWGFFGWILLIFALSYVLFLPFRRAFSPPAELNLRLVDADKRSPLGAFLTVNGLPCFVIASLLVSEVWRRTAAGKLKGGGAGLALASVAIVAVVYGFTGGAVAALAALICLWAVLCIVSNGDPPERLFVLVIALFCGALFLGCEIVYLKDFYSERLQRQNTVFKFYYQAWILSSLLFAAGSKLVFERLRGAGRIAWGAALSILVVLSLIYPLGGVYHRCQRFGIGRGPVTPYLPTLDGAAFIRHQYPEEYAALQWIRRNLPGKAVILEASGEPFSYYGRVSTFAGRPTVLGWANHESLWRDWSWKKVIGRLRDVEKIYKEPGKEAVKPLLRKYGVDFVYVGPLERKRYGENGTRAFGKYFPLVFRNADVSIYAVGGLSG